MQTVSYRKIYVAGAPGTYLNWMQGIEVLQMENANLVVFTGGTDISPSLYGKKAHPMTQDSDKPRDAWEKEVFTVAHARKIPMVGICRGAQFLCAMNGGILVQHQRHPSRHIMHTDDGLQLEVTSDHHQRAFPWVSGLEFRLIGWSDNLSPFSEGESSEDSLKGQKEAEIVYYPKTRSLGIQSHPEWQWPAHNEADHKTIMYMRSLINKLIAGIL